MSVLSLKLDETLSLPPPSPFLLRVAFLRKEGDMLFERGCGVDSLIRNGPMKRLTMLKHNICLERLGASNYQEGQHH